MKCERAGRRWLEETTKRQERYSEYITNGQFAYSTELNTCVCYYHMSYRGQESDTVTDMLSDKDLLIWKNTLRGIDARSAQPRRIDTRDEFDRVVASLGLRP